VPHVPVRSLEGAGSGCRQPSHGQVVAWLEKRSRLLFRSLRPGHRPRWLAPERGEFGLHTTPDPALSSMLHFGRNSSDRAPFQKRGAARPSGSCCVTAGLRFPRWNMPAGASPAMGRPLCRKARGGPAVSD